MSRIADIRKNLIGTEGSDDLMMELMEAILLIQKVQFII